jgi:peptidoglycan/xylan/chitin deacetylase (PgdA/CDA1 family)
MWKSMWIKLPTVALAVLAALLLEPPWNQWLAAVVLSVGTTMLLAIVCSVKSSFFAPTAYRSPRATDAVALTFDDGPDPTFTTGVLDALAQHGVAATFFVVGQRVRAHPELVARMHGDGHLIGNHTDTHSSWFHFRLWRTFRREITACGRAIETVIGRAPTLFRSPLGFKNPALGDVLRELGMTAVGWQVRGRDAVSGNPRAIEARVVDGITAGGVILLHDGSGLGGKRDLSATVAALPAIIAAIRKKGLRFVRLDELLDVDGYRSLAAS